MSRDNSIYDIAQGLALAREKPRASQADESVGDSETSARRLEARDPAVKRLRGGLKPATREQDVKQKKLARKSPLATAKPAHSIKPKGYSVEVARARIHMDPAELKAFFKALPTTSIWYPYFFIQYYYGCRLSEPALILDEDVSVKKKEIIIRRLKKSKEVEGFREQVCAADPRVLECVKTAQAWKEKKKTTDNPFLFASNRQRTSELVGAERLSQLRNLDGWQAISRFTAHRMFQRIAKEIKLPLDLQQSQVLRHTRAVMMLVDGYSVSEVQRLLGHMSPKMTQRYVALAESVSRALGRRAGISGSEK